MKKTLLTLAIIATHTLTINTVYASGEPSPAMSAKESWISGSAATVGALAAGPFGLIVGALSGKYLGSELNKADQYEDVLADNQKFNTQLSDNHQRIALLERELQDARRHQQQLQMLANSSLEFQVLFHTGDDTLEKKEVQRLDELANFLQRNPELQVRLHGYADPRGTDEYNNVLSQYRAKNVSSMLQARGIEPTRISSISYGSDKSEAARGDLDAYAFERRVSIEVFSPNNDVAVVEH